MIDIAQWMPVYRNMMLALFGRRVAFVGLQGSYGRDEAKESSDIDVVLVLDHVDIQDLKKYRDAVRSLPESGKICGFVSGRAELANWCGSDLFQFYHDTVPVFGKMDGIIDLTARDASAAVLTGACNIYHLCSQNFLHQGDIDQLKGLYKTAFFILQAKNFHETGKYRRSRSELAASLQGEDAAILKHGEKITAANTSELETYTQPLLVWASRLIGEFGENRQL